ncbi:MAG: ABC transporter permease [Bacteroidales bacterium]|jgi:ABC-2 type transport system permease protein
MYRFWSSVKKELLLLLSDKTGFLFMFVMPLILVFIITIIQDSAFKKINENKISLLFINQDRGEQGKELFLFLKKSGLFELTEDNTIPSDKVKSELLNRNKLVAVYIPCDFSSRLDKKAHHICSLMMEELNLIKVSTDSNNYQAPSITFCYDPVMQEAYSFSITNIISSFLNVIENSLMIENFYKEMGINKNPLKLKEAMISNKTNIISIPATTNNSILPNSTQHNVPAWTIFAMFFMVVSLGNNIVKERINGSFVRLKTMPVNFSMILFSKMLIYLIAAFLQVIIIFSIGIYLFPFINLPQLVLPPNIIAFCLVVIISAIAAVSYALMIGSLSKTQEQSNGFGAISIIIFAALGGILVPTFVMPHYLRIASDFSPMHWCLEGFYTLFLKSGDWIQLIKIMIPLIFFIILCQVTTYIKLKTERII